MFRLGSKGMYGECGQMTDLRPGLDCEHAIELD